MNLKTSMAVYQKELLEISRDRRTLISMVVVPLVAIPLMLNLVNRFMSSREKQAEGEALTVGVLSEAKVPTVLGALKAAGFRPVVKEDLRGAVEKKEVAASVEEAQDASGPHISVYIDRTRQASDIAGDKIRAALDKLKTETVRASLRGSGISEKVLTPFTTQRVNVASDKKMSGLIFGSALGYIVILLMFTGAMYPAIDMTAGEKERRTLEAVLSSPAGRTEIVFGKIAATATAAFITAVLTLGSMAYSFRFSAKSAQTQEVFQMAAPEISSLLMALVAVIPTALMAASLMVAIALFAKSYKEGQSYLTPIVMLAAFPAVVGMLPGLELTPTLALIPIFNVCQLIKQIFLGDFSRQAFAIACIANLAYAAIGFAIAARIFKNEGVLFRV
ncbi:MAG TPA: ABC transporter permease [Bryobacteraceae bacterium]|nr:ABC transporter permease [Bryobacteraceae bacterium]